jgi:hypothetical protein
MRVGQTFKRKGVIYEIYKIDIFGRIFAEDEYHLNIICIPSYLKRIK